MHKRLIANWICFIVLVAVFTQPYAVYATPSIQSVPGNLQVTKAKKATVLSWEEYESDNEIKYYETVLFLTADVQYGIYHEPPFLQLLQANHQGFHHFQYRPLWLVHRIIRL